MYQKVLEILKSKNVDLKYVTLREFGVICIEKRGANENFKQEKKYFVDGIVSKDGAKVKKEDYEKAMDEIDGKQIMVDLPLGLLPGDEFGNYQTKLYLPSQQGEKQASLKHQKGQILIVHIWSSWCGSGQQYLKKSLEVLNKYQQGVRVVAINADETLQIFNNWFEGKSKEQEKPENVNPDERKQYRKRFHNLRINGWDIDHQFLLDFGVGNLPFICVVDTFGKIHYSGHPKEIDILDSVEGLLKKQNQQTFVDPYRNFQKKNLLGFSNLLTRQEFQKAFAKSEYLCIKATQNNSFEKEQKSKLQRVKLNAYYYSKDKETYAILEKMFNGFDKFQHHNIKAIDCIQTPPLQNLSCWKCKSILKNFPYYWLNSQKNQNNLFGCRKCVQALTPQKAFAYKEASVFLTGKWNMISTKLLGKEPGENKPQTPTYNKCVGCEKDVDGVKYVCLGCRVDPCYQREKNRVNLCNDCFDKYVDKRQRDVRNNLQKQSHKDNHPFLRILKPAI